MTSLWSQNPRLRQHIFLNTGALRHITIQRPPPRPSSFPVRHDLNIASYRDSKVKKVLIAAGRCLGCATIPKVQIRVYTHRLCHLTHGFDTGNNRAFRKTLAFQTLAQESFTDGCVRTGVTVSISETLKKRDTTLTIRQIICHSFTTMSKRCCGNGVNPAISCALFRMTQGQLTPKCESDSDAGG